MKPSPMPKLMPPPLLMAAFVAIATVCFPSATFAISENNPIHAIHYEVTIRPDLQKRYLTGETTLDFESQTDRLNHLSFAVHELKVNSVVVGGKTTAFSSSNGTLTIPLKKTLERGQKQKLTVRYEGTPSRGILFNEHSLYTSYDTCYWMICDQDNPGDKAALRLTVDLPKALTMIASGSEVGKVSLPDGLIRHVWKQDRPYSAYLFGFAAAMFKSSQSQAGTTTLVFLSESIEPEKLNEIFKDTGNIVAFFEEKSGIKFPHPRYAQVVVPGDEAQEVSSYSLLGSKNVESLLTNPIEDWAPVHELAHQWWGNYITCASWDHFWLNEGLVVFMTAAYKEHRWGKAEYEKELETARKRYQAAKDAGFDVPLTLGQSLPTLKMRRAIVYSKGMLFLDALRKKMGEAPFWSGLREYSIKFAGKTVVSQDFAKIMEAHGDSEVTRLFQTWVF